MVWEKEKDVFLLQPCFVPACLRGKELGQKCWTLVTGRRTTASPAPGCVSRGLSVLHCALTQMSVPLCPPTGIPQPWCPRGPLTCVSNAGFLGKHPGADGVPSPRCMCPALNLPHLVQFSSSFLHPSSYTPRPPNPSHILLQCDNNLHFWELTPFLPEALKVMLSEVVAVFVVIKGFAPSSPSPSSRTSLLLGCTWNPHMGGAGQEGLLWGHSPFILWATNGPLIPCSFSALVGQWCDQSWLYLLGLAHYSINKNWDLWVHKRTGRSIYQFSSW